jgi:archaellum component FlaC
VRAFLWKTMSEPEVTNGQVAWTVNRDTMLTVLAMLLAVGVSWGTTQAELDENKKSDEQLEARVRAEAERTADRLDNINDDLTDIKVRQGEFGSDIRGIKSRLDEILKNLERIRQQQDDPQ